MLDTNGNPTPNGTYRYLCAVNKLVFYSHHPVGQILHDYGQEHYPDEVA